MSVKVLAVGWNFAPITLDVPEGVFAVNEKLAISLSQLWQQIIM